MSTVLVVGVFDLFHRGHVELLRRASELGDRLVVVINGDHFTQKYKRRPIFSEEDRAALVGAVRYVDAVEISNSSSVKPWVEKYDIDAIAHGDDWEHSSYMRQIDLTEDYVAERGIRMVYLPYYAGISTSDIIKRMKAQQDQAALQK
jgi:glycerol-3-phosphate cytidylyltransferase